jgi:hypothetical protein
MADTGPRFAVVADGKLAVAQNHRADENPDQRESETEYGLYERQWHGLSSAGEKHHPGAAAASMPLGMKSAEGGQLLDSATARPRAWHGWNRRRMRINPQPRFFCRGIAAPARFKTPSGGSNSPTNTRDKKPTEIVYMRIVFGHPFC